MKQTLNYALYLLVAVVYVLFYWLWVRVFLFGWYL